jgi:hypothetical protein
MKIQFVHRAIPVWLCLGCLAVAQEKRPSAPAAVEGIKGVKEEAAAKIKNIETGTTAAPKNAAQGVNKVDGVNTVNGVKADGRPVVLPPPPVPKPVAPPPPPPPPTTRPVPPPIVGTAVNVAVGTVGTGAVRPVTGVTGINAAKLQNLEAALAIKGGGPEKGAKGKAAAAALLGAPGPGPKAGPKTDGRAGFQEFEKLITPGS